MKKSYTTPALTIVGLGVLCQSIGFNTNGSISTMSSKEAEPLFEDEEDDWDDALDY